MRLSRRERMGALSQFGKNFETSSGARDSHGEIVPHCCGPMLSTLRTVSRPKRFQVGQRGSLHDVIYRPLGVGVCDSSRAGVQPNTTFLPNYRQDHRVLVYTKKKRNSRKASILRKSHYASGRITSTSGLRSQGRIRLASRCQALQLTSL